MLVYPPGGPQLPGHMLLVPLAHVPSVAAAEEGAYEELNAFKAALHAMWGAQGRAPLFLETATRLASHASHAAIHCVPLPAQAAGEAPLFFRKALLESEEWTTNAPLLDTAGRGLRRAIPPGFPYFHVAWAGGGMVHPIEAEDDFPPSLGMDTLAGMLGVDPPSFGARARRKPQAKDARALFEEQRAGVLHFLKAWEPFDFTKELG